MFISLLLITALSLTPAMQDSASPTAANVAGIVNGDTISLDAYAREVGRKAELNSLGGTLNSAQVMEQTWKAMVHRMLIHQEADRRLLRVTDKQVDSVLLQATPDFVKRGIIDDKGRFDKALLTGMLYSPDSLARAHLPKASNATIKKNAAAIRKTIGELRSRLADQLREERLRAAVQQLLPLDTASLRSDYNKWCYRATADLLYLACEPQPISPTEADIKAWFNADPTRYKTETSMRQLGLFRWDMVAAPFDSNVALQNIRTFIAMINGEHNPVRRDSIWNAIAESVHHTSLRLHPDSVAVRYFYDAVQSTRNGRPGTCIGPLFHPDGVHVILVDSVIGSQRPTYSVRVMMASIEPGQQTVDSILADVHGAVEAYRSGTTAEGVAKKYHKRFIITRWVAASDSLLGSYRLVQAAFEVPVGAITNPVDTPDEGVVLAVVIDSIPPGSMPIEAARDNIIADITRDYACVRVTRKAESLRAVTTRLGDGRMFVAESIPGSTIWRDIAIDGSGYVGPQVYDPTASLAIRRSTAGTLMGPFRGDAGWWIANTTATDSVQDVSFEQWLQTDGVLAVEQQLEKGWRTWLDNVERSAAIIDFRWIYFRY